MVHKGQSYYAAGQHSVKAMARIEKEIDVCQKTIVYYEKRLFDYHENDLSHNYEDTLRRYENLKADRLSDRSAVDSHNWKGKLHNFMTSCHSLIRSSVVTGVAAVLMAVAHILYVGLDFGLMGIILLLTLSSGIGMTWMIADCILQRRSAQVVKRSAEMELDAIEAKMAEMASQYESIIVSNRKRAITLFRKQEQLIRQTEVERHQEAAGFDDQNDTVIWNKRLV
ncbi:hypothetical protein [Salinicoccus bachuensis]|uniref:SMODS and SLOG-associating 2TM effector domain-containing protein n=1 Tax=Salinicoccus bachuensis TaxID=3136731 RepID=A0ABZ3CJX2_9STAP